MSAAAPSAEVLADTLNNMEADGGVPRINIFSGRTLADVRASQPEEAIRGGLAVRKITTAVSSMGGLGKTTLQTQMAIEGSLNLPVFGHEDFQPNGPLRVLMVNAEDALPAINYILGRMLPAYGLDHVPYDEFVVAENGGSFPLTSGNTRALINRINDIAYDLVMFDPKVALLPSGFRFLDPGAVREFLNDAFGAMQRETDAAYWLSDHDNKGGQALTGPADWGNFSRLALHLERGDCDGELKLTTIKANLGYRFKCITLERDPATGRAEVLSAERFGDRSAKPTSVDDVNALLSRLFRTEIVPLPGERRTKDAVRAALYESASPLGVKRQRVRDFVDTHIEFEERKHGRTHAKVAVRLVPEVAV